MTSSNDVLVERDGDVLLLIFNRPEQRNAVSPAMFGVLMEQLDAVKNRGAARAVILTGNGRGFCAGADLSAGGRLVENRATIEEAMNRGVTTLVTALSELPVPVIAADTLRFEAHCQGRAFATADFVEGVAAYQEKRKPRFSGR